MFVILNAGWSHVVLIIHKNNVRPIHFSQKITIIIESLQANNRLGTYKFFGEFVNTEFLRIFGKHGKSRGI